MVEVLEVGKRLLVCRVRDPTPLAQTGQRPCEEIQQLPHPLIVSRGWRARQPGYECIGDGPCGYG